MSRIFEPNDPAEPRPSILKPLSQAEISSRTVQASSLADKEARAKEILNRLGVHPQTRDDLVRDYGADRCFWIAQQFGGQFSASMIVRLIRDKQ